MKSIRFFVFAVTIPVFSSAVTGDELSGFQPPALARPKDCPTVEELGYEVKALMEISLDLRIKNRELPADCSKDLFLMPDTEGVRSGWEQTEFYWAASEIYHQPLYFDQTALERYGQGRHPSIQPWLSGAHFFGTFPLIPYKISRNRMHDRVYNLGYYRVGTPIPCIRSRHLWE